MLLAPSLMGLSGLLGIASLAPRAVLVEPSPPRRSLYYVRMSAGYGVTGLNITSEPSGPPASGRMPGLALDFLLGLTPVPGLSLGVAMLVDTGRFDPDRRHPLFDSKQDAGLLTFGVFADVFPVYALGLHAGGMFGHGTFTVNDREASTAATALVATGLAGALWLGYDAKLDAEWSLGSMLRISAAHTEQDGLTDFSVSTRSIAVMLSVLHR